MDKQRVSVMLFLCVMSGLFGVVRVRGEEMLVSWIAFALSITFSVIIYIYYVKLYNKLIKIEKEQQAEVQKLNK